MMRSLYSLYRYFRRSGNSRIESMVRSYCVWKRPNGFNNNWRRK